MRDEAEKGIKIEQWGQGTGAWSEKEDRESEREKRWDWTTPSAAIDSNLVPSAPTSAPPHFHLSWKQVVLGSTCIPSGPARP